MRNIIWSIFKIIFLILVFSTGYILAHEGVSITPLNKGIDKISNLCGETKK